MQENLAEERMNVAEARAQIVFLQQRCVLLRLKCVSNPRREVLTAEFRDCRGQIYLHVFLWWMFCGWMCRKGHSGPFPNNSVITTCNMQVAAAWTRQSIGRCTGRHHCTNPASWTPTIRPPASHAGGICFNIFHSFPCGVIK